MATNQEDNPKFTAIANKIENLNMKISKQEADIHNLNFEIEKFKDNFPSIANKGLISYGHTNSVESQNDISGK